MENKNQSDSQLIELIEICLKTQNFKKLSVLSFILTESVVDKMGMKLGIHNQNKRIKVSQFLSMIARTLNRITKNEIIKHDIIDNLKKYEIFFNENEGILSYRHIELMYEIYFDLRLIEEKIPYIAKEDLKVIGVSAPELNQSLGFRKKNTRSGYESEIDLFFEQKIHQESQKLKKSFHNGYFNKDLIKKAIKIRNMKLNLKKKDKKITTGTLKNAVSNEFSLELLKGLFILGCAFLFFCLSVIISFEMCVFIESAGVFSPTLFVFASSCLALCILYWSYFREK